MNQAYQLCQCGQKLSTCLIIGLGKLRIRGPLRVTILLLAIALSTVDFVADWVIFFRVYNSQAGLVFGQIDRGIVAVMLGFLLWSSCLYIAEVVVYGLEMAGRDAFIPQFVVYNLLLTIFIVWTENIPQSLINVVLAMCHEVAITTAQLVKAIVLLGLFLFRFITAVVRMCRFNPADPSVNIPVAAPGTLPTNRRFLFYFYVVLIIGAFIQGFLNIALFQFTYVYKHPVTGHLRFKQPTGLFMARLDPRRYFDSVDIFVCEDTLLELPTPCCLRLTSILAATRSSPLTFTLQIEIGTVQNRMRITRPNEAPLCVQWKGSRTFTEQNCAGFVIGGTTYTLQLIYESPSRSRVLGIIRYSSQATPPVASACPFSVKYYENVAHNVLTPLRPTPDGLALTCYSWDSGDLASVGRIWRTGYAQCESTAPFGADCVQS